MAKAFIQNRVRWLFPLAEEKCDLALAELRKYGECEAVIADVTVSADRGRLLEEVEQHLGGLSILVNNAGANWGAPGPSIPMKGLKVISTNLNAVCIDPGAVPCSRNPDTDNPSRIVNIGSMDGLHVPVVQRVPTFACSASKAALHHLTRALAVELGPEHITVNAVAPGFFESRMTDYIFEHYLEDIKRTALYDVSGKRRRLPAL